MPSRPAFLFLCAALVACGLTDAADGGALSDAGAPTEAACNGLEREACLQRGCHGFSGSRDAGGATTFFCGGAGGGCGAALSCATDPQGLCWQFTEFCHPPGYGSATCGENDCPPL